MSKLSDIRKKKTPIKLGNKTRYLHYDLNAFAELEEIYGSIDKAMEALCGGSVKAVINVLWAGLLHESEELSQKDVGKMFDFSQMQAVGKAVSTAINEAMPHNE